MAKTGKVGSFTVFLVSFEPSRKSAKNFFKCLRPGLPAVMICSPVLSAVGPAGSDSRGPGGCPV